jgi:hypothetical protein
VPPLSAVSFSYVYRNVDAKMLWLEAVLGIRIRMFLGLPDPDPLVRGPDPPFFSHKGVERTEIMLAKKILTSNLSLKQ